MRISDWSSDVCSSDLQPEGNWNLFDTDVLRWLLERRSSISLLRQFNELRIAVEPQAAKLAATRATPPDVAAIGAGLHRMREAEIGRDRKSTRLNSSH